MKPRLSIAFLGMGALALALAELLVRLSGATDFPLYLADSEIGYIPSPSQSGRFLRRNDWQFNSKSMGAPEFAPSAAIDTLLIGDSVVLGGNPDNQEDRLGPQLESALNHPVWPISAGSWSLRNQLKYLKLHPEVSERSDQYIFILNNGDFGEASSWSCEKTHPTRRPLWATLFVLRKYVWDWKTCGQVPSDLRVADGSWKPELREFFASVQARNKSSLFMLYPNIWEMRGEKSLDELESYAVEIMAEALATHSRIEVFSVARDSRWKVSFYRDTIHPTTEGTKVLAKIIARPAGAAAIAR